MGDNFAAEAATFASEAIGRWRQYLQFSGGEQLFKHGGRMFHVGEVDAAFVRRKIVTPPLQFLQPLDQCFAGTQAQHFAGRTDDDRIRRSEEHTSELQSLMRRSYADFCLNKTKKSKN